MPLGHTNLSYYKAKNSTYRDGSSQEETSRGSVAGWEVDAETERGPALLGPVGLLGSTGLGFPECADGELLLTNSFGSKVQVKFLKSVWAQRHPKPTAIQFVPLSRTSGQRWTVHSPR